MADVKWIKMATNMFDNRKIRQIECLPDGYTIIVIWMKLLCLAGNVNDGGLVYFTKEIPYTEQMLSVQFNVPITTLRLALNTFEQFEMIEVIDDVLMISNWEKYQNIEGMEKVREQTRLRNIEYRKRKKEALMLRDVTMTSHDAIEEDIEEDIDIKEDIYISSLKVDYQQIVNLYNSLCPSYPCLKSLSDARKKAIKARLNKYSIDDFKTLFTKAEASDFLKGDNSRNWSANFDWLIKDTNMAKVIDGNYDNKGKPSGTSGNKFCGFKQTEYDFAALERECGIR